MRRDYAGVSLRRLRELVFGKGSVIFPLNQPEDVRNVDGTIAFGWSSSRPLW